MDGSFLSNAQVIDASRDWVCIRLATYEDREETEFLKTLDVGRGPDLENTVFAMLSPDASKRYVRSGRGPHFAFRGPDEMAERMQEIVQTAAPTSTAHTALPFMQDVDVALNVAACDLLPVAIVITNDVDSQRKLTKKLLPLAWEEPLRGQLVFALARSTDELRAISGVTIDSGVVVVEPDSFGLSAQVIYEFKLETTSFEMQSALANWLEQRESPSKNYNEHIRLGTVMGLDWKTEVPVTDQQSINAKERYRRRMESRRKN